MITDDQTTLLKLGAGIIVGGLLSLKNLPGNRWQRAGSFILSIALGAIIGMSAIEYFKLELNSWTAVLAVATATAFGYALAINAMQQIPEWLQAARRRILGS